jgi:copper transport protein
VIALLVTGTLQSVIYLESFGDLTATAFGRAILIKIGLIAVLIAFGAWNQRRALPALVDAAEAGETPGAIGVKLRRSLRTEIGLFVVVLGVTSALVSYSPTTATGDGATGGPFAAEKTNGPVQAQVTVDPARVGRNTIHLYLFDAKSGAAFEGTKELTASISLPARDIGPLELKTRRAGPGHYVVEGAAVAVKGDWALHLQSRVSEFDEYSLDFEVPIR